MDALRHREGIFGAFDVQDQRGEFVPAQAREFDFRVRLFGVARHQVGGAYAFAQPVCRGLQDLVSGVVAERVVHILEPVEVHEQHAELAGIVLGAPDFPVDAGRERPAGWAGP